MLQQEGTYSKLVRAGIDLRDSYLRQSSDHLHSEPFLSAYDLVKGIDIENFKIPEPFPGVVCQGNLYLDSALRISLFFIPKGTKMRLHDHPEMYVICKILKGSLTRHAYSLQCSAQQTTFPQQFLKSPENPVYPKVLARKHSSTISAGAIDLITPEDNLHQFIALQDSVFIDLIAPDYDNMEIFMNTYTECEVLEDNRVVLQMGPPKLEPNVKVTVDFR